MAESSTHMNLVRHIVDYISGMPCVMPDLIESDLPEYSSRTTQSLNQYYPDVYYCDNSSIIIGEAKTDNDINNPHTMSQLDAYIAHLSIFKLRRYLILSGSFFAFPELKNLIIRKRSKENITNIDFHIIAPFHKPFVI